MGELDLRFALVGGIVGALIGALYHLLTRKPRQPAPALDPAASATQRAERERQVTPFVERAARAMIAYGKMVDAANAGNLREIERLFRRLREEEAESELAELTVPDRAVVAAARAFLALHQEIGGKVEQRLAAGQAAQVGGELRVRAPQLGRAIEELNHAATRYVAGR